MGSPDAEKTEREISTFEELNGLVGSVVSFQDVEGAPGQAYRSSGLRYSGTLNKHSERIFVVQVSGFSFYLMAADFPARKLTVNE